MFSQYLNDPEGAEVHVEIFLGHWFISYAADEDLVDGDVGAGTSGILARHGSLRLHSSPVKRVRPGRKGRMRKL